MKQQRCARKGCRKPVPKVARLHGDLYCSTVCFRAANGFMSDGDANHDVLMSERGRAGSGMHQWRKWQRRPGHQATR